MTAKKTSLAQSPAPAESKPQGPSFLERLAQLKAQLEKERVQLEIANAHVHRTSQDAISHRTQMEATEMAIRELRGLVLARILYNSDEVLEALAPKCSHTYHNESCAHCQLKELRDCGAWLDTFDFEIIVTPRKPVTY